MPTCRSLQVHDHGLGVAQEGEPEEGRQRLAHGLLHRREAELDLGARLERGQRLQVGVRPGVGADRVPAARVLLHHLRIGDGHAPDEEERRLGAMGGKGVEHGNWCRRATARRRRSAPPRRRQESSAPCTGLRRGGQSSCRFRPPAIRRARRRQERWACRLSCATAPALHAPATTAKARPHTLIDAISPSRLSSLHARGRSLHGQRRDQGKPRSRRGNVSARRRGLLCNTCLRIPVDRFGILYSRGAHACGRTEEGMEHGLGRCYAAGEAR